MENKSFEYTLSEETWTIHLVDDTDPRLDEDSRAEVWPKTKEILFKKSYVSIKVILHELWHVWWDHLYLQQTTSLSIEDVEEISANLFENKCIKSLKIAQDLYERLKK